MVFWSHEAVVEGGGGAGVVDLVPSTKKNLGWFSGVVSGSSEEDHLVLMWCFRFVKYIYTETETHDSGKQNLSYIKWMVWYLLKLRGLRVLRRRSSNDVSDL